MGWNGCFRCETIFASSVPRYRAFGLETQVLPRLSRRKVSKMLRNTLKHRIGSNGEEWLILLRNYFRMFGTLK